MIEAANRCVTITPTSDREASERVLLSLRLCLQCEQLHPHVLQVVLDNVRSLRRLATGGEQPMQRLGEGGVVVGVLAILAEQEGEQRLDFSGQFGCVQHLAQLRAAEQGGAADLCGDRAHEVLHDPH